MSSLIAEQTVAIESSEAESLEQRPPVSRLVWLVVILTLVLIPFKIVSFGYLPQDDALRHAAKAVSGREWSDVLVLRDEFKTDHNPGWHWVLAQVHRATDSGTDTLVTISICALFLAFALPSLGWFKRPEAWVAALLAGMVVFPGMLLRQFLGRPYIFTIAITLILLLLWRQQKSRSPLTLLVTTLLLAASAWIHGSWYLFALVVGAFALARQWQSAIALGSCWLAGSFLGALLTGHPFAFLANAISIAINCFGQNQLQRMLVSEFGPSDGSPFVVLLVGALLLLRSITGGWTWKAVDNPIFILAVLGWILGLRVVRFWEDWGLPALTLWIGLEVQHHLTRTLPADAWRRIVITAGLCLALFFSLTSDYAGRWTRVLTTEYLSEKDAEMAPWLPEEGGIIYSADMGVFYQTFFKNPDAKWKYILGFEATFMPPDDLKIFRNIQWNYYAHKGYEPWVAKMRPQDRMVIRSASNTTAPSVPGLEWKYVAREIWIGRLPHTAENSEAQPASTNSVGKSESTHRH